MVSAKSKHKTCAYRLIDHIVSPKVNAQVAEYFGEAPANRKSCAQTEAKDHCAIFHANDETYFSKVHYWTTPIQQCLDGRAGTRCTDYAEWTKAWTSIRNS
jgi:putative spermidine/putrescine transport system substrate-binding protein